MKVTKVLRLFGTWLVVTIIFASPVTLGVLAYTIKPADYVVLVGIVFGACIDTAAGFTLHALGSYERNWQLPYWLTLEEAPMRQQPRQVDWR